MRHREKENEPATALIPLKRFAEGQWVTDEDVVIREKPLTLFLNDDEMVTIVCTPIAVEELIIGFLYSEGVITAREQIKEITINLQQGVAFVETTVPVEMNRFLRRYLASCCGRTRPLFYFAGDAGHTQPVNAQTVIAAASIINLMADFSHRGHLFAATGGTHAAALASSNEIVFFYEDIGRHNAVDKIIGRTLLSATPTADKLLLISGRISAEMVIKAMRLGTPLLVSRAAPTNLAIELAAEANITLIGFARNQRFNIYTHPQRVVFSSPT